MDNDFLFPLIQSLLIQLQALVVQNLDSTIHRINHYQVDKY